MAANRSSSEDVVRSDPRQRRPTNADESVPEALVPDIVRTDLQQEAAPAPKSDRWARIQRRAYELAQQRGFSPGAELNDWLQAEREIDGAGVQGAPEDQITG
jgi:hypothetical protein